MLGLDGPLRAKILSFLPLQSIINACSTSQAMNFILSEDLFWKDLLFRDFCKVLGTQLGNHEYAVPNRKTTTTSYSDRVILFQRSIHTLDVLTNEKTYKEQYKKRKFMQDEVTRAVSPNPLSYLYITSSVLINSQTHTHIYDRTCGRTI